MNKGFSIQGGSAEIPSDTDGDIALMIYCSDCKKGRNFGITANLNMIGERRMKKAFFVAQCEKCKRVIEVRIGWVDRSEYGWTAKNERFTPAYQVKDDLGLGEMHE